MGKQPTQNVKNIDKNQGLGLLAQKGLRTGGPGLSQCAIKHMRRIYHDKFLHRIPQIHLIGG